MDRVKHTFPNMEPNFTLRLLSNTSMETVGVSVVGVTNRVLRDAGRASILSWVVDGVGVVETTAMAAEPCTF